jgi:alanine racemase
LVGSVSMDTLCINITTISGDINIGDAVELWGENISVNEISNTFAYELLAGVTRRVKRVVV